MRAIRHSHYIDRLAARDAEPNAAVRTEIDSAIAADREAAVKLDRLIASAVTAF